MKEARRTKTGRRIPCPGAAHSNPFIDNCGLCAPAWGEIDELEPIDMVVARSKGLVVRAGDLTDAQHDEAIRAVAAGEAEWVGVTRRNTSYFVLRWKEKK